MQTGRGERTEKQLVHEWRKEEEKEGERERRGEVQILPNRHSHHLLVSGSIHVRRSCSLPSYPPSLLPSLSTSALSFFPFHPLASLLHPRTITALVLFFSPSHLCLFVSLPACQAIPLWFCVYSVWVPACVVTERERERGERERWGRKQMLTEGAHDHVFMFFSACQSVLCCSCVCVCVVHGKRRMFLTRHESIWWDVLQLPSEPGARARPRVTLRRPEARSHAGWQRSSHMYRLCAVASAITTPRANDLSV